MNVTVYSQRDKTFDLDIPGHIYSPKDKAQRALKGLFGFWGLAAVSILLPVAHFVLVPVFFILAPIVAYIRYQADVVLEAVEMTCPECAQKAKFSKNSGSWPLHAPCPLCLNRVYFTYR
jgi:hypothetical protein